MFKQYFQATHSGMNRQIFHTNWLLEEKRDAPTITHSSGAYEYMLQLRLQIRRLGKVRWGACMQWQKAFQLGMRKVTPVWWRGVQVRAPVKRRLSLIVKVCCTSNDANQWPGGTGKMETETGFCFQGKNGGNRILFPQCSKYGDLVYKYTHLSSAGYLW